MKKKKQLAGIAAMALVLCGWLYVGEVTYSNVEEGDTHHFFVKAQPTFQFFFYNPYADDWLGTSNANEDKFDASGNMLPETEEFSRYLNYCKSRYGIDEANKRAAHDKCRLITKAQ